MDKYFKQVKDTVYFTGDTLEIYLPMRYEDKGVMKIGTEVSTMGIFDMKINSEIDTGYFLPASITINPTDIEYVSTSDEKFAKLILKKDDIFIKNVTVVQEWYMGYLVFYEILYSGKVPKSLKYEDLGFIFDIVTEVTGVDFAVDHAVVEMLPAMLHRDKDNINLLYRLTDMKKKPRTIPMRLVSHAALSTTGKVVGAYMADGVEAAMLNPSDTPSFIEDILRS